MAKAERPSEIMIAAGRRLRAAREVLAIRQEDFARRIGVERTALSNWETGQRLPDVLAMTRLYREFGITLEWIYAGDAQQLPYNVAVELREKEERRNQRLAPAK